MDNEGNTNLQLNLYNGQLVLEAPNGLLPICELWNMTPCELIESVNTEQSRVAETLNKLKRGDLDIAAYEDEHKYDGDGDEPA